MLKGRRNATAAPPLGCIHHAVDRTVNKLGFFWNRASGGVNDPKKTMCEHIVYTVAWWGVVWSNVVPPGASGYTHMRRRHLGMFWTSFTSLRSFRVACRLSGTYVVSRREQALDVKTMMTTTLECALRGVEAAMCDVLSSVCVWTLPCAFIRAFQHLGDVFVCCTIWYIMVSICSRTIRLF
jgi:hypothetical protein